MIAVNGSLKSYILTQQEIFSYERMWLGIAY